MENQFKPNIYPIMYWALAFGAAAGVLLFLITIASAYIGAVWFPIFLIGMIWGGYRNYRLQKAQWYQQAGQPMPSQSPVQEFKQAISDIAGASQEIMTSEEETTAPAEEVMPEEMTPEEMPTPEAEPQVTPPTDEQQPRI